MCCSLKMLTLQFFVDIVILGHNGVCAGGGEGGGGAGCRLLWSIFDFSRPNVNSVSLFRYYEM